MPQQGLIVELVIDGRRDGLAATTIEAESLIIAAVAKLRSRGVKAHARLRSHDSEPLGQVVHGEADIVRWLREGEKRWRRK
jgi:hypothetical protein